MINIDGLMLNEKEELTGCTSSGGGGGREWHGFVWVIPMPFPRWWQQAWKEDLTYEKRRLQCIINIDVCSFKRK